MMNLFDLGNTIYRGNPRWDNMDRLEVYANMEGAQTITLSNVRLVLVPGQLLTLCTCTRIACLNSHSIEGVLPQNCILTPIQVRLIYSTDLRASCPEFRTRRRTTSKVLRVCAQPQYHAIKSRYSKPFHRRLRTRPIFRGRATRDRLGHSI